MKRKPVKSLADRQKQHRVAERERRAMIRKTAEEKIARGTVPYNLKTSPLKAGPNVYWCQVADCPNFGLDIGPFHGMYLCYLHDPRYGGIATSPGGECPGCNSQKTTLTDDIFQCQNCGRRRKV